VVYVETQNSTYRITFVESADEAQKQARVSATVSERDHGVEVTLVEQIGIDATQSKR
jgi:predicted Fe-Mo cluster-binding NifX family protein